MSPRRLGTVFFFSSRRRHTRFKCDWSSDVCSSDLMDCWSSAQRDTGLSGQYYANLDNPVSRWADDQQSMFYNLLCPGKAALNAAFICGTNVVIRAAALDEIGGLPQDSVTEDFAASIALHPSWRSFYLTDVLATGLQPLDVPSYLKQQGRWALGTMSVFRTHWREIFLPKKQGLRIGQRVQYFLACTHYLCGL